MYTEITAAIQSAKTLAELLKAANGLSNYNEIIAAVSAVNAKLMQANTVALQAQEKQASLAEHVRELEDLVAKSEDWERQMKRYALFEFPTGALAYALQPGMEQGEPMHYLCATCASKKQASKLQPVSNRQYLQCYPCNSKIQVSPSKTLPLAKPPGSPYS